MPEITSHRPRPASPANSRTVSGSCPPPIRSRIGADVAGGFYPAPHRYHLYLSSGCPHSLRVSITLDLLGLRDSVTTTLLTPDTTPAAALDGLRRSYEATEHHFDGPLTVPALCDRWSGHVVSNHTPDILGDLTGRLAAHGGDPLPLLRPPALAARIDAWHALLAGPLAPATLDRLDHRLAPTRTSWATNSPRRTWTCGPGSSTAPRTQPRTRPRARPLTPTPVCTPTYAVCATTTRPSAPTTHDHP